MYGLHFSKEGIFFNEWNDNLMKTQQVNLIDEKISLRSFYSHFVSFDENLSVGDFINHLYAYRLDIEKDFCSYMGHYKLRPFFIEASKESKFHKKYDISTVSRYELYWNNDISYTYDGDGDIVSDGPKYLDFQVFGHGINRHYNPKDDNSMEHYSLSHVPLRNWKHLPLVLNEDFDIIEIVRSEMAQRLYFSGKRRFTVFDAIAGFLNELTINGSPSEQKKMYAEFEREIKKIEKEAKANPDYYSEAKINEELFITWEQDKLAKYHAEEKYEKAANSKKIISILTELIRLKKNHREEDEEAQVQIEKLSQEYYKLKNW